jgi:HPt (histidine-containing phosphotransfer) domain-containing protein
MNLYGNGAAYMPVLKSFAAHIPALLEELPPLIEGDLRQYAIKVHGLKGSCGTICAPEAAAMARDLETAAEAGDTSFVRARHGALEKEVKALAAELAARITEWEAARPEQPRERKPAPDRALLERLAIACSEYRADEIEGILGELEQPRYETGGELVQWLREQAVNFEYDAIQNRLKDFL